MDCNIPITQTGNSFSFIPTSLKEAMEYASLLAKSTMVPRCYHDKPSDILIAIQLGAELGLKPLQSLQNIATINGRPCIWGDAMLALVQSTSVFEEINEYYDEEKKAAICTVKRRNQSEHTVVFSEEDAKKAGLWNKPNTPWITYPRRMLQMRARGFALRDKFADALGGLITAEEAQDYSVEVTPKIEKNIATESVRKKIERVPANQFCFTKRNESQIPVYFTKRNESQISDTETPKISEDDGYPKSIHLQDLIKIYNVPDTIIANWCKGLEEQLKISVPSLEEFLDKSDDLQKEKCINYLLKKYSNNEALPSNF